MKTKKTKKVEKPPAKTLYRISLTLGDKVIEGEGATMTEAVKSLPVPVKITTKGIIKATFGERKVDLTWTIPRVRRLFFPLAQPLLAKQIDYLMR